METDMSKTIAAKSDQLNADDLIAGPITIEVTKVTIAAGEQPATIHYKGDNGKPYKPCLTMRRVIVGVWGKDSAQYVGRQMTLYREAEVRFGGMDVGGIRISHMSHMDGKKTMALMVSKGKKKPVTISPLATTAPTQTQHDVSSLKAAGVAAAQNGSDALKAWWGSIGGAAQKAIGGADTLAELKGVAATFDAAKSTVSDDDMIDY